MNLQKISDFKDKKYWSAIFLDAGQTLTKFGTLGWYILKCLFTINYQTIIELYLVGAYFLLTTAISLHSYHTAHPCWSVARKHPTLHIQMIYVFSFTSTTSRVVNIIFTDDTTVYLSFIPITDSKLLQMKMFNTG